MIRNRKNKANEKAFAGISLKSFITVVSVLFGILIFSGVLSYIIPQGSFARDDKGTIIPETYEKSGVKGIAVWRVLTAPFRVFGSEDALTIIMISIFLLVMSGVFNLLEKTDGIKIFIARIMKKLKDKGGPVICITVLIFMAFGSLFGMFEELVTLLPIIILFMLSMKMDTMMGLGACLLAACFGFSAAITNPFSVGIASQYAEVSTSNGVWLRILFFAITYVTVCVFLMYYLKKIEKNPQASPSYETDLKKKEKLEEDIDYFTPERKRTFKVYSVFFAVQGIILILIASVRAISGLAVPILAASFLITGLICGFIVSKAPSKIMGYFLKGAAAMLPAVFMIALASSVKLVMTESGIMDTIMNYILVLLIGKSKYLAILLIYLLILFLQLFIGSASAKIFLVMPIILPITQVLGISPALVILTYCMADGFTDVILPTNPVLLIGLSMADVSYFKWVKWTWKLQLFVFVESVAVLFLGAALGY